MSTTPEAAGDANKTLTARIVAVVEALSESTEPVGPRGLARQVGIDRNAVGRILRQLSETGFAIREKAGYIPGPRLFAMSRTVAARDDMRKAAIPILRQLAARFNETCYVCVRRGDRAVLVYGVESTNPLRYTVELGEPFPLYAGAPGRAILSGLAMGEVTGILGRTRLEPITPRTVTSREQLLKLIKKDAALGYTETMGERIEGGFGIAAPFFDQDGVCVGSIVFTSPATRLDRKRVPEYRTAVKEAAAALSARLGHRAETSPVELNT